MKKNKAKDGIVVNAGNGNYIPNIVRGGAAIPIGKKNFYYMQGRKHEQGGIDVGRNAKTGLEVEGEEVMQVTPNEVRVYSSVPFLRGVSPAELVLNGADANKVFAAQEKYKNNNRINDDGTKYKYGGINNKQYYANNNSVSFRNNNKNNKTKNQKLYNKNNNIAFKYLANNDNIKYNDNDNINITNKSKMGKLVSINGNVKNGLIHTPNQDVLAYNKERKSRFNGRYSKPGLHNLELLAADLLLPKGKVNIEPDVPKRLGWVEAHNRLVGADISQKPLDAKKDNTNVVHTISETERRTRKFVCGGRFKAKTGTKKDNVIDEIVINAARPKLSAYSVLKDNDTSNRHSKKVIEREVYQADALSSDRLKTKIDNTPYKEKEIDTSYGDRIVTPLINSKSVTKAERNTNIRGRINNEYDSVEELLNRKTVDNDLNVMPVQDDVAKTRNMDNILLGVNLGSSVLDAVMGNIYANQMHGYTAPNITAPTIKNPGEIKLNEEDLKDIPAPILMAAAKLKTRYNANPQLSKIEDDTRRIMGEIGRNTSNSRVALARKQRAALQGQQAKNEVYGRKENIETELINKDKLNQQEVTARNLARYDQYNQALAAQRANRARLRLAADTANIQNKLAVSTANAQLKSQADRFNTANKINQLVHQAGIDAAKAEARSNIFSGMLGNIGSALNTWNRNKHQAKLDEETLRVLGLLAPNANKLVLSALGY